MLPGLLFCSLFPIQQTDHERDWPPCNKLVFFGLATNTLNVRNNNFVYFQVNNGVLYFLDYEDELHHGPLCYRFNVVVKSYLYIAYICLMMYCFVFAVFLVVVVVVFFTLTDRASTIPNNTRGCQSGTWSAGQKNIRGTSTKLQ